MTGKPLEPLPPCKLCGCPDICPSFKVDTSFEWMAPSCDNPNCDAFELQLITFETQERANNFWRTLMSTPQPQAGGLNLEPIKARFNDVGNLTAQQAVDFMTICAEIESLRTQNQSAERRGWERGIEAAAHRVWVCGAGVDDATYVRAIEDAEAAIRTLKPEEEVEK